MLTRSAVVAAAIAATFIGAQAQQPGAEPPEPPATTTELVTGGAPILTAIPSAMTSLNNYFRQTVYDPTDKTIGEVSDVLVDKEGKVGVLIVSVGGFLGLASKDVAVPFSAVQETKKDGKSHLTMNTTRDALKAAPGYKYDQGTASWVPA